MDGWGVGIGTLRVTVEERPLPEFASNRRSLDRMTRIAAAADVGFAVVADTELVVEAVAVAVAATDERR